MNEPKPILNWVREDNHDVVLTGGAVLAGKAVRLQSQWPPWGAYTGPERFTIRTAGSPFARNSRFEIWADVDGPPRTHSVSAWQAGTDSSTRNQRRYFFRDAHGNESGQLTVSNVKQYTKEPKLELESKGHVGLPVGASVGLVAHAGRASTTVLIGATEDPTVRVRLLSTNARDTENELLPYLFEGQQAVAPGGIAGRILRSGNNRAWAPVFRGGERELILNVDEDHPAEVTIVPEEPYSGPTTTIWRSRRDENFAVAFALLIEDVDDTSQHIISDIVTVESGEGFGSGLTSVPPGSLWFRTEAQLASSPGLPPGYPGGPPDYPGVPGIPNDPWL
jgi:hypothetical protein